MKKIFALVSVMFLVLGLNVGAAYASLPNASGGQEKPIVVCTTTVLGSTVQELAGENVELTVFVQPGICPAFYDIKPGDLYSLEKAAIVFYHGFEYKMWLKGMLESTGSKAAAVKVSGNWNTPEGAKNYVSQIAAALKKHVGLDVSAKAAEMISEIDKVAGEIKSEAEALGVNRVNVICMEWQKPFVSWVGFSVVASYGPPETLPAGKAAELASKAKAENVKLIIDNLQSGTGFGASLSSEVGAVHVVLTNFPGAIPGTESLPKLLKYNAERLFKAVEQAKYTEDLRSQISSLEGQLTVFEVATIILAAVAVIEGVFLYARKR